MQNGQLKDVRFADGLKIGNITKLLSVPGVSSSFVIYIPSCKVIMDMLKFGF